MTQPPHAPPAYDATGRPVCATSGGVIPLGLLRARERERTAQRIQPGDEQGTATAAGSGSRPDRTAAGRLTLLAVCIPLPRPRAGPASGSGIGPARTPGGLPPVRTRTRPDRAGSGTTGPGPVCSVRRPACAAAGRPTAPHPHPLPAASAPAPANCVTEHNERTPADDF